MNNFIVGQVTPDMLDGIRYGTYIFFGLITFLGALFIAFFVPETKQLSLGKSLLLPSSYVPPILMGFFCPLTPSTSC